MLNQQSSYDQLSVHNSNDVIDGDDSALINKYNESPTAHNWLDQTENGAKIWHYFFIMQQKLLQTLN